MDNNKIGQQGAALLADGIRDNETMTDLRIANCSIMEEGAISIAAVLGNKKNLLVLDVTSNKIMVNGCVAICKAI